ncbi:30S ribosomal protein S12 methylthiotransferase accessory factor YcaO [Crenobacter caeni]|uniref:30s ribosomal protein S12 methylthiotransferase accessory protein YcaO n=1 Tax=Crenobacter caeni TaxID=2705474 RepID=A0A6B2KU69_9NEIS|nr:30S ribosomal protein S12 methylthiotransferase accessory factor YcaO [Crenobacter caeni]NDV13610.1 30s ribosomal protein S12 methylthiotransferase accessory protein YcaO [Crenobacter caeni]
MSHTLPGKDATLEDTIATLQGRLAALGFHPEEVSWLHPVDGCWSVHLRERDCPLIYTNGKGGSELAARASALGEMCERLGNHYFWTHYYLGRARSERAWVHFARERWFDACEEGWPDGLLDDEALRDFYDPDAALAAAQLTDFNSGDSGRGVCALPYTRVSDGKTVWFPVNLIGNLYLSNGMAAGNTAYEARTQALSEVVERAVKFRVLRDGLCLPDIPPAVIERHPAIAAGIASLRAAGFHILVKDASLGGRYPVACVTLVHPHDRGVFASFGAHPSFAVALERALTELLQGRALDALAGFPEPAFDPEEVASPANLELHFIDSSGSVGWPFLGAAPDFAFCDWNFEGSTAADWDSLCALLHEDGNEIYVADFEETGVYCCRVIVPGLSEIYPVDDLEWENNNIGNPLRAPIARLPELSDAECRALADALDAASLADEKPVWELIGLAADPDSAWASLRVGELRALIALALCDEENARAQTEWVCRFGQLPAPRMAVWRVLEAVFEFGASLPDYRAMLATLWGEHAVATAEALKDGRERFFGLNALGENFEGSERHRQLLAAYDKLTAA